MFVYLYFAEVLVCAQQNVGTHVLVSFIIVPTLGHPSRQEEPTLVDITPHPWLVDHITWNNNLISDCNTFYLMDKETLGQGFSHKKSKIELSAYLAQKRDQFDANNAWET